MLAYYSRRPLWGGARPNYPRLSPQSSLFFDLYVNDLQFVFENRLSITLPNGVKFNSHLCADDQRPACIKACNRPAVFFYSSRLRMF